MHLFAEDKDFNQGPFAEMVRDQHLEERDEYLQDLEAALRERAKGPDACKVVTVQQIIAAFAAIDPKKLDRIVEQYVRTGVIGPSSGPKKGETLDLNRVTEVDTFMYLVSRGVIKSSTKRDEIDVCGVLK